ncbi:hypothetical protein B0H14DRAFT_2613191 [Mycena olivaceomarginata]|nr:hypothetical protein B0H14DRAFT_2613191 [Mycena olivaceomarginata]
MENDDRSGQPLVALHSTRDINGQVPVGAPDIVAEYRHGIRFHETVAEFSNKVQPRIKPAKVGSAYDRLISTLDPTHQDPGPDGSINAAESEYGIPSFETLRLVENGWSKPAYIAGEMRKNMQLVFGHNPGRVNEPPDVQHVINADLDINVAWTGISPLNVDEISELLTRSLPKIEKILAAKIIMKMDDAEQLKHSKCFLMNPFLCLAMYRPRTGEDSNHLSKMTAVSPQIYLPWLCPRPSTVRSLW